ncbi:hypothetical protein SESBI_28010 [Sesbania bispinosa]|nr:hypothetical protein SESBI_28010 [Sesbania bispinosa]
MVKIDSNTLRERNKDTYDELLTERAKFARLCIEVDLRKVLVSTFQLNGRIYKVEYEVLHLVCFHCGWYRHGKDVCPLLQAQENEVRAEDQGGVQTEQPKKANRNSRLEAIVVQEEKECFGPWMIAQRRPRRKPPVTDLREESFPVIEQIPDGNDRISQKYRQEKRTLVIAEVKSGGNLTLANLPKKPGTRESTEPSPFKSNSLRSLKVLARDARPTEVESAQPNTSVTCAKNGLGPENSSHLPPHEGVHHSDLKDQVVDMDVIVFNQRPPDTEISLNQCSPQNLGPTVSLYALPEQGGSGLMDLDVYGVCQGRPQA